MKCRKCGVEYSDKVLRIHEPLCKAVEEVIIINMDNPDIYKEMTFNELRQEAKHLDLGKNPKKAEIVKALEREKFGCEVN